MRKAILGLVGALLCAGPLAFGSPQQPSVADAARKSREQKKAPAKPARVFTNDDLDRRPDAVSVVGAAAAAPAEPAAASTEEQKKDEKGEAYWRKKFADARANLRNAEKELDILQRELNLQQMQYYSDPNKALREQLERKDINEQRKKIEDKRKEIAQHRQALSDLEDDLRRSGGDSGWAREQ